MYNIYYLLIPKIFVFHSVHYLSFRFLWTSHLHVITVLGVYAMNTLNLASLY